MIKRDDFLVEIHTEELPPKALLNLAKHFSQHIQEQLEKESLDFASIQFFATPRRLAVLVMALAEKQPEQSIFRRGPAKLAAFDAEGKPTPAALGFAKSLGVSFDELSIVKNQQGEWLGLNQQVPGKTVAELMPTIVTQALSRLPIPKRMRWGDKETLFVRPVHSVILLFGDKIIEATILGCAANRLTRGHRFLASEWLSIPHASQYADVLEKNGFVIADFEKRKETILKAASAAVKKNLGEDDTILISSAAFLDEITGLVEWPTALCGKFDKKFLDLPQEVLISAMEDHQRYFPVIDTRKQLLAHFICISNIASTDPNSVIHGNERVLRARLADAEFFYATDKKETLEARVNRLKGIIFQAKLGTLYDKSMRISQLAKFIAAKIHANEEEAARAGLLAKSDLTTQMVNEFPELQGLMGYYYALHEHEPREVALALKEHYLPRFAGDVLPSNPIAQSVSLADKIDTLIGTFGINQIPTGDKDPFGLRRAAVGIIRILIEKNINLTLQDVLAFSVSLYDLKLENQNVQQDVWNFIKERLRSFYQEEGVPYDVFAAVIALNITNLVDIDARMKAVQTFKKLKAAEHLSIANKRVSNILVKYVDMINAKQIDPAVFDHPAELELARQLDAKSQVVTKLSQSRDYEGILLQLTELREPIDEFFDHVMVMTEDKTKRENRILLLSKLRALFLQVADIALLQ